MQKMNNIGILNKNECCGCSACISICNKDAIFMKPDVFGFLYPTINEDKCINCGACARVCPEINGYDSKHNLAKPICVAARHIDINEVKKSRSGGVFKAVGDFFLLNHGVIYGASFNESWLVKHIRVDNIYDLEKLRGSKYVQSDITGIYIQVKNDLDNDMLVLFSGTPCQCAGLYSFLDKKKTAIDKLFVADIVCHGAPSPYIWNDYVKWIEKKYKDKIISINMRDKEIVGWNGHEESFTFILHPKIYRHTFRCIFHTELISRNSCFNCKYTNIKRPSDITLADFWKYDELGGNLNNDNKGISQILLNTEKGQTLFEKIKENLKYEYYDIDESAQYNMQYPTPKPIDRGVAEKYYCMNGFESFMKRYSNFKWNKAMLYSYRRYRDIFRNFLKKKMQ